MNEAQIIQIASGAALVILAVGMLVAAVRLVRGPDSADRIVALDLISVLVVAFLAALSVRTGYPAVLDVAIAYALVAFLGTVALARWRQRQAAIGQDDEEAS